MSDWHESDVIGMIREVFPKREDILERGIGDDCAILSRGHHLVSTDASIEGVHFNLDWMTPGDAAYRCLSSNISDIAAMGASAGVFTLALGLPGTMSMDDIRGIFQSLKQCIWDHGLDGCWLVGGDVVRSPVLMFSITIMGELPPWPIVCRDGARPDDCILALGRIGYSAAGLELFEKNLIMTAEERGLEPLLKAFRRPLACAKAGMRLAEMGLVSSMMDLSDGIYTDLPRLLSESHCGADLEVSCLVPSSILKEAASLCRQDPLNWMIFGGEDFGLLITAPAKNVPRIEMIAQECGLSCCQIGVCRMGDEVVWKENKEKLARADRSFSHF